MTATHEARYCRCGTRLARDNATGRCSPCSSYGRHQPHAAPDVPADFWDEVVLREALQSRHMGRVIRAWRTHPHHGRHPISQDRAASWVGMSQAQLSRIETGPPIVHLDRLVQWATALRIPEDRLWFAMPTAAGDLDGNGNEVNRRQLLGTTAATAVSGFLGGRPIRELSLADHEAVEWFAWHLWQHRKDELDPLQIPGSIASRLSRHPHVMQTTEGAYRFTDPALTDVLVAHRVFGDIAQGSGHLLATAQTSHATDLTISALAADDDGARRGLTAWMRRGATAVLRVNSAGILAKVGAPELGDAAICTLRADQDARHLYLTAVASRVLNLPWEQASHVVSEAVAQAVNQTPGASSGIIEVASRQLSNELANARDAAARWCSAVLLANCHNDSGARSALMSAVQQEACRENLRAYAAVLAGTTPLAIG
ncbi:Helix-turn-helix domain-containing protein [Micromonospora inyonensis]|uniref:Helix-turn-helix domain-containing protein n=1 Tax=Micromonospora inyonensis TaxID=47866 RepID=A0A1C6RPD8_9ACTN|nr:Helix-turn-helix domain-containing protein [Micromonospora inyonensis]